MKRLFSLTTCLLMAIMAFAQVEIDGLYYYLNGDEATVAGYERYDEKNNKVTEVVIPSSVQYGGKTYPITKIGHKAFYDEKDLASIIIPNTVMRIGYEALHGTRWYDLQPDGLIYVGTIAYAWKGQEPTEIVIKDGTTCINDRIFIGFLSLVSVSIPKSVKEIGYDAFAGCYNLQAVYITDLAAWCNINFKDTYYDEYYEDNGIRGEDNYDAFGDRANPLWYAHHLFLNGEEITDLVIPASVTSISSYAFAGGIYFTSLELPSSIKSIGDFTFLGCCNIPVLQMPSSIEKIGWSAFFLDYVGYDYETGRQNLQLNKLREVHLSDLAAWCRINFVTKKHQGPKDGYDSDWEGSYHASPTMCGDELFLNGNLITDLVIPEGVTSIGAGAFCGNEHITSITIPSSVSSIGELAFGTYTILMEINSYAMLPPQGDGIFYDCKNLYVPSGCKEMYQADSYWNYAENILELGEIPSPLEVYSEASTPKYFTRFKDEVLDVELHRNFQANKYYTLALPFDVNFVTFKNVFGESAKAYRILNRVNDDWDNYVKMARHSENISAGEAVLILPSKYVDNPVFNDVTITWDEDDMEVPTFGKVHFLPTMTRRKMDVDKELFFKTDGTVVRPNPDDNWMNGFRGYLYFPGGVPASGNISLIFDDDPTVISLADVDSDVAAEDAPAYNLAGQRVGRDYKGIVIVNGKKVKR